MQTFSEFELAFNGNLQQERSDLQGLVGSSEAQLAAWIRHLFQAYLGYTHWKEITSEGSAPVGSKGSKQLFPDLRIHITDTGIIFIECKRFGRLDGSRGKEEFDDAIAQLKSYIRAHIDKTSIKPKTVLGIVTDGNHWTLVGLDRQNDFHTIARWTFLTDDPRLLAQRMWLLAKPALAQPTSAVVEFLARRTLAEVLKENTRWLTKKVNEGLPEGTVSEELVSRWLRDAFSDSPSLVRPTVVEVPKSITPTPSAAPPVTSPPINPPPETVGTDGTSRRITIGDLIDDGCLRQADILSVEGVDGRTQAASLTADARICVGGQFFDTPSGAAVRALEMAGKPVKAINGWSAFRVLRDGADIGSLADIREQYEAAAATPDAADSQEPEAAAIDGAGAMHEATIAQLKTLLGLLPEVSAQPSKTAVTLYLGKIAIGYVRPRKRGLPRVEVYVGDQCPEWCSPHSTYAAWCDVGDWSDKVAKVVELVRSAPRRRADDMASGKEPYRRRT